MDGQRVNVAKKLFVSFRMTKVVFSTMDKSVDTRAIFHPSLRFEPTTLSFADHQNIEPDLFTREERLTCVRHSIDW